MTDRIDHLRTIAANPDDMGPRKVFADWMEERGECEHAEYVRCAVELDNYPKFVPPPEIKEIALSNRLYAFSARRQLQEMQEKHDSKKLLMINRCAELLAKGDNRQRWTMEGLPEKWLFMPYDNSICLYGMECRMGNQHIHPEFSRGFPERLTLSWEEWIKHYRTLIEVMPVRQVTLTSNPDIIDNMATGWEMPHPFGFIPYGSLEDSAALTVDSEWIAKYLLRIEFAGADPQHPIRYKLPATVQEPSVVTEEVQFLMCEPIPVGTVVEEIESGGSIRAWQGGRPFGVVTHCVQVVEDSYRATVHRLLRPAPYGIESTY